MNCKFHVQFNIKDAKKLLYAFIIFEIFLVIIFILDIFLGFPQPLHKLFDLNGESTLPAWFSSMQLFLIGILFLYSGYRHQKIQVITPRFLLLIGIGFIFLSMDESAVFHERTTQTLRHIEWIPRFKGNHGIWIPIYSIITSTIVLTNYRPIFSMWKAYPRQLLIMFIGVITFILGAVGMEIYSYWYLMGINPLLYKVEVACEEFFEMLGASIILYGAIIFAAQSSELIEEEGPPTLLNQRHHLTNK
jgi:hypothetical protein